MSKTVVITGSTGMVGRNAAEMLIEKGFKILSEMLNKNGLMLIALYSEHARFNVNIARKVIKKAELEDTREDILKFRNYIIETNDELLNPLRYRVINDNTIHINDFYSLSL